MVAFQSVYLDKCCVVLISEVFWCRMSMKDGGKEGNLMELLDYFLRLMLR